MVMDEPEIKNLIIKPHVWVIVAYSTKSQKKHFAGKVLSIGNPDPETCAIRYIRKVPGSQNTFQWPEL